MKVLVVGGGGREHALAWKLAREGDVVVAAPGNPGIAEVARCVPVRADDLDGLAALAAAEGVDYTLVGPEAPLASGIADLFGARGLPVFGPTRAAAQIETSKAWAKRLMLEAGVPTARATVHTDAREAKRAAEALGAPVVVKASGLAAGKGVVVARSPLEAYTAIDDMLVANRYGAAGAAVLVEECMEGEELSLFALTDGEGALPLPAAQDHKRLLAGDRGPNTGGMGAYAPVALADDAHAATVLDRIVAPTLAAMRARGAPFRGVLYVGLMLTAEGPRVVEFNCRFGDPETQALMPLLDAHGVALGPLLAAAARGALGGAAGYEWPDHPRAAVTTVLAAAGYPDAPRMGDPIALPAELPDGVHLFHAGTARAPGGDLVTAGGRVLAATAVAPTFAEARRRSRAAAEGVEFAGKQYRDDIGWRETGRRRS